MPIQFLYTDKEILKLRSDLLRKTKLSISDLELLKELNDYIKTK